jgi:hypothetical protein
MRNRKLNPYGVQTEFILTARARAIWGELTRDQVREMKREYIETGRSPQGIQIHIRIWGEDLTQGRARARLARWRGGVRAGVVDQYGDEYTTLHDYDDGREPPTIEAIREIAAILGATVEALAYSTSHSGGAHLAITWGNRWQPLEIVALQAILGSDPKREAFNLLRVRSGTDLTDNWGWNVLYSRKLE